MYLRPRMTAMIMYRMTIIGVLMEARCFAAAVA
jgi:hypothetical protein